jgi:CMP-N-acetylneuraminic acid synthetase
LRLNREFPELTAEENTSVRGFSPLRKVSVVQQSTERKKDRLPHLVVEVVAMSRLPMKTFRTSAPLKELQNKFGFTAQQNLEKSKCVVRSHC